MSDIDLDNVAFKPQNENPRDRVIRKAPLKPIEGKDKPVRVCCISDRLPWTHEEEQMLKGKTYTVPEWLADHFEANELAARV